MDPVTIAKLLRVFKEGIEPENLPMVLADVYQEVIKTRGLSNKEITKRCEDMIYYLIDNTSTGKYDQQVDAIVRPMVPGMIVAFMNIRLSQFSFKKYCC